MLRTSEQIEALETNQGSGGHLHFVRTASGGSLLL